jgi:hypothetical protein
MKTELAEKRDKSVSDQIMRGFIEYRRSLLLDNKTFQYPRLVLSSSQTKHDVAFKIQILSLSRLGEFIMSKLP